MHRVLAWPGEFVCSRTADMARVGGWGNVLGLGEGENGVASPHKQLLKGEFKGILYNFVYNIPLNSPLSSSLCGDARPFSPSPNC